MDCGILPPLRDLGYGCGNKFRDLFTALPGSWIYGWEAGRNSFARKSSACKRIQIEQGIVQILIKTATLKTFIENQTKSRK